VQIRKAFLWQNFVLCRIICCNLDFVFVAATGINKMELSFEEVFVFDLILK
jgi:hypothetical protein